MKPIRGILTACQRDAQQVRHIDDAAWIILVEKWNRIVTVVSNGVPDDRLPCVHLGMSVFSKLYFPSLTVLVGGIVRNVDLLTMIHLFVPFIQELYTLILFYASKKVGYLRVAVHPHLIGKQWMLVCVFRIVLAGVIL